MLSRIKQSLQVDELRKVRLFDIKPLESLEFARLVGEEQPNPAANFEIHWQHKA
jgi:hypothetical protein